MQRRCESARNCHHYYGRSGSLLCSCRLRFRYPLEFQRQMPVHQRRPAVNIDQLTQRKLVGNQMILTNFTIQDD